MSRARSNGREYAGRNPLRRCRREVAPHLYEANHLSCVTVALSVSARPRVLRAVEGQFNRDSETAARRIFKMQSTAEQLCESGRHREIETSVQLFAA